MIELFLFQKVDRQMHFSLSSIKCSAGPPILRLLPNTITLSELCTAILLLRTRQKSEAGRSHRTFDWR